MKLPTTEPLFAGGTVDVDRLNGHKLRIDLSTEEARARLLTDAGRQELNGAAHAVPAAKLNGSAAAIGHNSGVDPLEYQWSEEEIRAVEAGYGTLPPIPIEKTTFAQQIEAIIDSDYSPTKKAIDGEDPATCRSPHSRRRLPILRHAEAVGVTPE